MRRFEEPSWEETKTEDCGNYQQTRCLQSWQPQPKGHNTNQSFIGSKKTVKLPTETQFCVHLNTGKIKMNCGNKHIKKYREDQREGSAVRCISCSPRGPGFESQQLHGGSWPCLTPVPGDPTSSPSGLCRYRTYVAQTYT